MIIGKAAYAILAFALVGFINNPLHAFDDLTALSDEFDRSESISDWSRIYQVEGWGNDALEQFDINTTQPGRMYLVPHSSSWFEEWRGVLVHKRVTNDFVITTDVEPRNRALTGPPASLYSLSGIMVRAPRAMKNASEWAPFGQNYVFLSLGAADTPGTYQYEVKTTSNSVSVLYISNAAPARATIQVARLGSHFIMLRRDEGSDWQVHRRYYRPDMPQNLQAGLTVYTDWPICEAVGYEDQNTHVLTNGAVVPGYGTVTTANADLVAAFDYVRFARPQVPVGLLGADFSNPSEVSDEQLLSFLGEAANVPGGAATEPRLADPAFDPVSGFSATITNLEINRTYQVKATDAEGTWNSLGSFVSQDESELLIDPSATNRTARLYRVNSP